jgi:hypothetical protein
MAKAFDKMMMNISAVFFRARTVSDRVKGAMYQLKPNRKAVGSKLFGYRLGEMPGERIPLKGELGQVKKIFKLALKGKGVMQISERIKLNPSLIRRILRNPIYAGKRYAERGIDASGRMARPEDREELIDDPQAVPVVSFEDWEKAQQLTNVRRLGRSHGGDLIYELDGIIKCSKCKSTLTLHYDREGWKFLRCTSKYRKVRGGCKEPIIGYAKAKQLVYAYTRAFLGDRGFSLSPVVIVNRLGKLRKEIGVIEKQRRKYIDLYDVGDISKKDLDRWLKPHDDKLTEINRKLTKREWEIAKAMQRKDFVRYVKDFEAAVKSGSPVLINKLLKALWPFGIESRDLKKFELSLE